LLTHELLIHVEDNSPYFVPGRDLESITIKEVLDVIRGDLLEDKSNESFAEHNVVNLLRELDSITDDHLANKTIKDLINSDIK